MRIWRRHGNTDSSEELRALRRELEQARAAINTILRTEIAKELAPALLKDRRAYQHNEMLVTLMNEGYLKKATFVQKPSDMLRFYGRTLSGLGRIPQKILEIGVKGGGSTALWKAMFPQATVIGFDIKLPAQGNDGVIYVQGDQSSEKDLNAVATRDGPFDIVIDDGSHVIAHQVKSLTVLFPSVRSGGLYIIEDIHTGFKTGRTKHNIEFGEDIWADFTATFLEYFQTRTDVMTPSRQSDGARLAQKLGPRVADLILANQLLGIRSA